MSMKILIMGGNRFFGRHLAENLLNDGHQVTLLNRGKINDGFGGRANRIHADRKSEAELRTVLANESWDLIFDQICYTAQEARSACKVFEGRAQRYIVTSSESVFDDGVDQPELNFNPIGYEFAADASPDENYQEAKRQVEAVFSRQASFEVTIVRPSLVVGTDDYTDRLKWHIDRVQNGLPIYFPDLAVRSDFIRSDQAGFALKQVGLAKNNPQIVNCTTRGSVELKALIKMCEDATGKKAVIADKHERENHSPYGGSATKTMNTDLLYGLGFSAAGSQDWLANLIHEIARGSK